MADKTWNVSSGTWATAGNWSPQGVPASGDTVYINSGSCTVAGQSIANVNIGGDSTIAGTNLVITGDLYVAGGCTLTFSGTSSLAVAGNLYVDGAIQQTSTSGNLTLNGAGNVEGRFGSSSNYVRVVIGKTAVGNTVTFTTELHCEYVNTTTAGFTFTSGTIDQNGQTIYTRTLSNAGGTARNWYQSGDVWITLGTTGTSVSATQTTCTYTNRDGLIRTSGVVATQTMSFGSGAPSTCPRLHLDTDTTYVISGSLYDFYPNGTMTAGGTLVVFNEIDDRINGARTYTGMTLNRVAAVAADGGYMNCGTRFGTINFYAGWTSGTTYTSATTFNIDFCRANTITNQAIAGCTWNFNSIEIGTAFTINTLSTGTASTVYVGYARPISGVTATTNTWGASGGLIWNIYIEDWDVPGTVSHGAGNLYIGYNSGAGVYCTSFTHATSSRAQNFGAWWGDPTWIITKSNQPSAPTNGLVTLNGTNFTCNSTNGGWKLVGTGSNTFGTMNNTTQAILVHVLGGNITIGSGTIAYLGIEDGGAITVASNLTINKGYIYRTGDGPGALTGLNLTLTTSDGYNYNFDQRLNTVTFSTASQTWTLDNVICNTLNLNGVGCTYNINGCTVYTTFNSSTTAASAATTFNYNGGTTVALNMITNNNNVHNFNGSFNTTGVCTFSIGTLNLNNVDLVTGSFVSNSGSTRVINWGQNGRIWSSGTGGALTLNNNTGLTYTALDNDPYWAGGYVHGGTGVATGLAWTATVPAMRWNTWHTGSGTYNTWYTQTFRALAYSTCTGASSIWITGDFYAENGVVSLNGITLTQIFNSGTIGMDGDPINIASYTNAVTDQTQNCYRLIANSITLSGARSTYYLGSNDNYGYVKITTNGTLALSGTDAYFALTTVRGYNVTMTASSSNTFQVDVWDYAHNRHGSTDGGVTFTGVTGGLWTHTGGKLRIKNGYTLDTWAYTLVSNTSITNKQVIFEPTALIRSNGTGYLDWRYEPAAVTIDCSNNDSGFYHNSTGSVGSSGNATSVDGMFNLWVAKAGSVASSGVAVRNLIIIDGGSINSPYTCYVSRDFTGYTNNTMSNLTVTQFLGSGLINYTGKGLGAFTHALNDQGTITIQNLRAYTITLSGARNSYDIGSTESSEQYLQISANGTLTLSGTDSYYNLYRVRSYNTSTPNSNITMYINVWNYEHNYYNSSNVFAFDQTNPAGGTFTHYAGQLTIKSGYRLITWAYTLASNASITNRAVYFEEDSFIKSLNTGYLDWRYEPTTTTISCGDNAGLLHYGTGGISSSGNATSVDGMFNLWIYSICTLSGSGAAVRNFNIVDGSRMNSPYTIYVSKDWTGYTSQTMSNLTVQQYLAGGNISYNGSYVGAYINSVANTSQNMQYCPAFNITLSGANSSYFMGNGLENTYVQLPTNGTITLSGNTATYEILRVRGYNLTLSGTNAIYNCYEYSHNLYNADPPIAGPVTHTAGTLVLKNNTNAFSMTTWAFASTTGTRGITFEDQSYIVTTNTGTLNVNYTSLTSVCAETDTCGFYHNSSGAWQIGPTAPASPAAAFNLSWSTRCTVNASYVKNLGNWYPRGDGYRIGTGLLSNTSAVTVNVSGNILFTGSVFDYNVFQSDSKWQYLALTYWGADATRTMTYRTGYSYFGEGGNFRAFGTLTLANTFTGTLKLNNYFAAASVSHQGGTLDLNGNQLYAETSYTSTDGTVNKYITNTAATYSNPSIYINASTGTPWSFAYSNLLTSDSKIWIYVKGGTVSHGATARQATYQPGFDLTERVAAYTLTPNTDFQVGALRINNYTVPTNSVWTIAGHEFTVYTGGLTAPAAFTVNITNGGNGYTCQMTCDNTSFIWPTVNFTGTANIANSGWQFKTVNINSGASVTCSSGQTVYVSNQVTNTDNDGGTLNISGSTWVLYGANPIANDFFSSVRFTISSDLTGTLNFAGLNGTNLGDQSAKFASGFGGKILNNISYNTGTGVGALSLYTDLGYPANSPIFGQFDFGYNTAKVIFGASNSSGNPVPVTGSKFNLGTSSAGTRYIQSIGAGWSNWGLKNIESSSIVKGDYLNILNCPVTGGGGWYAGSHSTDAGGNTGWLFTDLPTYSLSRSAASVNEGVAVTITLTTTNVPNGTTLPYTITGTGITSADLGGASLTGNFTVNSNTASLVLNIAADYTTEGSETFTLALNNGSASISVTINDTSQLPTYSLSRSAATVTEGQSFTITLTTTSLQNGDTVPYTISGTGITSGDIGGASLTGNFTISNNSASLVINTTWDYAVESTETLTLTINPTYGTSSSISVGITNLVRPTYALSASPTSLNEGGNFTITLNTTDVSNNTTVPYTITGVSSADINGASLTGNFTVVNSTASVTFTTTGDYLTEGDETFVLTLNTIGTTVSVLIVDYYKTRTYSLSTSATTVVEGNTFTIILDTTNVFNGSTVPYTITGVSSADIGGASLTGNFTINNNIGTASFTVTTDGIKEGYETFTLTLGSPASGSIDVTIRDQDASGVGNFLIFFD